MLFNTNPIIKLISLISRKTLLEEVCEYLKNVDTSLLEEERVNNDKLYINNDKLYINNDKLYINNDKLYINNDKLYINNDKLYIKEEGKFYLLDESDEFIQKLISLKGNFDNSIEELKSNKKLLNRFLLSLININAGDFCTKLVKTLISRLTFLNLMENKEKYESIQNKAINKESLPEPLKYLKGEFNLLSKELREVDNNEGIYKVFLKMIIEEFPGKLEQEIMNWDLKEEMEFYINSALLILRNKIQLYCFMWSKIKEVESYKYFRSVADYEDLEYDFEYIKNEIFNREHTLKLND